MHINLHAVGILISCKVYYCLIACHSS